MTGIAPPHVDWLWQHPNSYAMSTGNCTWRLNCLERGALLHSITCLDGMRFKHEVAYLPKPAAMNTYKEKHEISGMNSSTSYSEAKQVGTRMCYQHVGGNL
jgi:hypothetical protein